MAGDVLDFSVWRPVGITKAQTVGFVDWLSLYQDHHDLVSVLPKFSGGAVCLIDEAGEVESVSLRKFRLDGSHQSAVFIRCDGSRVYFDGNVSKFSRRDNVFGYTFSDALERVNMILRSLELPPFSAGDRFISNFKGHPRSIWTGARVTRVDVTQNFSAGSENSASAFMTHLMGQQKSRVKTGTYGENSTVDWGRGSRRIYLKAYLKWIELQNHGHDDEYMRRLVQWCREVGLVRFECTYKATQLHAMGCHFLGGFDMRQIEIDFEERKEVLSRQSATVDDLSNLDSRALGVYRMWLAGDSLSEKLKKTAFYKYRKVLLPYGIDIAVPNNVVSFQPRTRVITLGPCVPPDFYEHAPTIEELKYANHR